MDWSKIPDILAVTCLASAFFSISHRHRMPQHQLWLAGWFLIALHFLAFLFANLNGIPGVISTAIGLTTLIVAGVCFMWATVPSETRINSRKLASVTAGSMSFYCILATLPFAPPNWLLDATALAIGLAPLSVALYYLRYSQHALRWLTVGIQFALGAELLVLRRQSHGNLDLCIDAILFVVYFSCCLYFWYTHKVSTTGSAITVCGFFAWSLVFIIAPISEHYLPNLKIENEIWNLPKYVVAIGMLLLMLEKQIERSQYLALHDDLTGLANRRLFQDRLNSAMERTRRSATTLALMQVDLDGFKAINDNHGHHYGDLLLQQIASLLQRRVRRSDTVARTGGDEFSIILEEPSSRGDAELVAESLVRILREPILLSGTPVRVGASIGIAVFPTDASDADSLCIEADMRMYQAKQDRKDVVNITRERMGEGLSSQTMAV
ncbi:diguanylate cyclase domain-containing protein [Acidicapsa dinghuensis]|uniref:Diguanylate cyclase domain-containing protein n=1 Tax=Acidicapsa dinghuensis TaxID=2218256 RepID=A0ABW1EJF9_9BACT|nr:GGDEF domain-containing protein [Acidicapsa dinghuensis]